MGAKVPRLVLLSTATIHAGSGRLLTLEDYAIEPVVFGVVTYEGRASRGNARRSQWFTWSESGAASRAGRLTWWKQPRTAAVQPRTRAGAETWRN